MVSSVLTGFQGGAGVQGVDEGVHWELVWFHEPGVHFGNSAFIFISSAFIFVSSAFVFVSTAFVLVRVERMHEVIMCMPS
jgi:hypothetical protein